MRAQHSFVEASHFEADELEAFGFKSFNDFAGQTALYGVWLCDNEGSFHSCEVPSYF